MKNREVTVFFYEGSEDLSIYSETLDQGYCEYGYHIYPALEFEKSAHKSVPTIASVFTGVVFAAVSIAFFLYDVFVQRRNARIIEAATKTNAIVLSLFPAHIRGYVEGQASLVIKKCLTSSCTQ